MDTSSPSEFHGRDNSPGRRFPEREECGKKECGREEGTLLFSFRLVLLVFAFFLGVIPLLLRVMDLQGGDVLPPLLPAGSALPRALTVFLQVYPMHLALLCAAVLPVWSAERPRLAGLSFSEGRALLFRSLDFNPPPREWKHRMLPLFLLTLSGIACLSRLSGCLQHYAGLDSDPQPAIGLALHCDLPTFAVLALGAVFLAPLTEELAFRRILYGGFKLLSGEKCAFFMTALLFTAIHFSLSKALPLFFLGCVLQSVRNRSGGITIPVILHAGNNLLAMSVVLTARIMNGAGAPLL